MNDPMNYYRVAREEWREFYRNGQAPLTQDEAREEWREFYRNGQAPLTQDELDNIKSLNDRISMQDVRDIYVPLAHLIYLYMKEFESLFLSKGLFLHKYVEVPPFIIGIAGSVAVGKSTTARLLQTILSRTFKRRNVQLITTDGFLYPNRILKERGIMDRKGFPESYDMEMLIDFLNRVKSGQEEIKVPVYSHDVYDIIPDKYELIQQPDILIVEGINTLQLPANQQIYVSDFFDFSVYVDADPELIEKWYLDRFDRDCRKRSRWKKYHSQTAADDFVSYLQTKKCSADHD